ncbi:MAG: hypothetical protein PHN80_03710 [Hespellia sp.]|nr:hypothetical protein [Hespellia sp.]
MQEMRVSIKGIRFLKIVIGVAFMWGFFFPHVCYAEFASNIPFENASWELVHQESLVSTTGNVQSICCTDDYIICIENVNDQNTDPDVVSAYYKNTVDENGNPVEQYSLAKRVQSASYEHANGMAYNPKTNEILVALYTSLDESNRGCIFAIDPDNLTFKNKVQISTDYNILGIDYMEDKDQYIIQTNSDGGYSFKILDSNFQVVEDLGEYDGTAKGSNFQDLCVDGDFIINFPLTLGYDIGNYVNLYSISQKKLISDAVMNINPKNAKVVEPESICETAPGEFLATVTVQLNDGSLHMYLYKTVVPYIFHAAASAKNGTVTISSNELARSEDCKLTFMPDDYYELTNLTINGSEVPVDASTNSYTISDIQSNVDIDVQFSEMNTLSKLDHFVATLLFARYEKIEARQAARAEAKKEAETTAKSDETITEDKKSTSENVEKSSTNSKDKDASTNADKTSNSIKKSSPFKWILLIFIVLFALFGLYLRIIYVRRVRYLKKRKARREWERARRIQEQDFDDDEFDQI